MTCLSIIVVLVFPGPPSKLFKTRRIQRTETMDPKPDLQRLLDIETNTRRNLGTPVYLVIHEGQKLDGQNSAFAHEEEATGKFSRSPEMHLARP